MGDVTPAIGPCRVCGDPRGCNPDGVCPPVDSSPVSERTIVKLPAIQRAYVDGLIDLAEMERRVATFLTVEEYDVSYSEAYVDAR